MSHTSSICGIMVLTSHVWYALWLMALQWHARLSSVLVTHPRFVWRSDALIFTAIPYNRETRVQDKTFNSHSTLLWYALCCETFHRDAVLDAAWDASLWTVSHQRLCLCNPHAVCQCLSNAFVKNLTQLDTLNLTHFWQMQASAEPSCCTAQEELKCQTVLSGAEASQLLWHVQVASSATPLSEWNMYWHMPCPYIPRQTPRFLLFSV